jgi:hypothetical protein
MKQDRRRRTAFAPQKCSRSFAPAGYEPDQAESALAVSFQEVVHSVWTVNAEVAKRQRFAEDQMDTHKNVPLTPKGREMMVRAGVVDGLPKAKAACRFNPTPKTVGKWIVRFEADG